ncbi:MAG: glutathione S-transferase C-terminal domain-containing protein [Candidatus Binataceae bacterium]|jgi:glutathione S-transferase
MAQYIEVDEAIGMSGLRVVLTPGVPGPWSEAAKGILHVKKIPYIKVRQELGGDNLPLKRWSAQTTAPVFAYNDERPRSIWNDQLYLAERLQRNLPLIPSDIQERALMFGLANEICGENGLGWSRRLTLLHPALSNPHAPEAAKKASAHMGNKYGYSPEAAEAAAARTAEIIRALAEQLASQRSKDSRFFVGDRLSALDIYWATFAALLEPLPDNLCPMPAAYRRMYQCGDPLIRAALTPQLLAHRDFIYHEYLELPVDL